MDKVPDRPQFMVLIDNYFTVYQGRRRTIVTGKAPDGLPTGRLPAFERAEPCEKRGEHLGGVVSKLRVEHGLLVRARDLPQGDLPVGLWPFSSTSPFGSSNVYSVLTQSSAMVHVFPLAEGLRAHRQLQALVLQLDALDAAVRGAGLGLRRGELRRPSVEHQPASA
jgi:hypothetical protein